MTAWLGALGVVMLVCSLIALIRPTTKIGLPTRKRALLGMIGSVILIVVAAGATPPPSTPPAANVASTSEPDEPCRVEASDALGRAAAQNWCQGGLFTLVNVSNDANTFIANLQFSKKGYMGWQGNRLGILNRFRLLTDEMVTKTDMSIAFSLHGPMGELVGGCFRKRSERESTCN